MRVWRNDGVPAIGVLAHLAPRKCRERLPVRLFPGWAWQNIVNSLAAVH